MHILNSFLNLQGVVGATYYYTAMSIFLSNYQDNFFYSFFFFSQSEKQLIALLPASLQ